jgi:hypothetical protein
MIPPQTRHDRATLRPLSLALIAALWAIGSPLAVAVHVASATSAARINLSGDLREQRQEVLLPSAERHSRVDREPSKGIGRPSRQGFGPCLFVTASHATADLRFAFACSCPATVPDNRDRYLRLAVLLI